VWVWVGVGGCWRVCVLVWVSVGGCGWVGVGGCGGAWVRVGVGRLVSL